MRRLAPRGMQDRAGHRRDPAAAGVLDLCPRSGLHQGASAFTTELLVREMSLHQSKIRLSWIGAVFAESRLETAS
jgi:hypothetical protein